MNLSVNKFPKIMNIMNIITETHEIICNKCKNITSCLQYYTYDQLVCSMCYYKLNNYKAVAGACSILPCKLCKSPKINWYTKETFGPEKTNCGNHNIEDDDVEYNIFNE
jgi:hypothetical protein